MKKFLFLTFFAFLGVLGAVQTEINQDVFDALLKDVSKFHYDSNFRQKYAQEIKSARPGIIKSGNNGELGRKINEFLRRLPDSHLAVMPPADENSRKNVPLQNDITLMESGGRVLVYSVSGNSGAEKVLQRGDEIVSVNGFIPDRNARIGMAVQLKSKFSFGIPGEKSSVEFIRSGRKMRKSFVNVRLKKMPKLFKLGEMPALPEFYQSKMLDSNTAYVRFDIFTPESLLNLRQDVKSKFKNVPVMVIDLRNNMGGLIVIGVNMASFLSSKRVDFGTMTIGGQKLNPKSYPQKDRYKGRIFILIGRNSYSTAEIFAQAMMEAADAVLIGETTSGMCLPSVALPLPHGFKLQTVAGDYVSRQNYRIEGRGVVPQKIVKISSADIISGRDPQLESAK
ncbi:MAG: hypothetical protein IKB71_06080 [Lentisphaeria bacterium]|nr:hypothetical protein [Lentisphaeria bacterium]